MSMSSSYHVYAQTRVLYAKNVHIFFLSKMIHQMLCMSGFLVFDLGTCSENETFTNRDAYLWEFRVKIS